MAKPLTESHLNKKAWAKLILKASQAAEKSKEANRRKSGKNNNK